MLGYIFIFFIGYYFYRLAENHDKNKWFWAVLGIVIYYASTLAYSFIYGLLNAFEDNEEGLIIEQGSELTHLLLGFGIGVIGCILFFQILSFRWNKEENQGMKEKKSDIDEIGKT